MFFNYPYISPPPSISPDDEDITINIINLTVLSICKFFLYLSCNKKLVQQSPHFFLHNNYIIEPKRHIVKVMVLLFISLFYPTALASTPGLFKNLMT